MRAKWKISPIPQSPNPNQRPQLRTGLLVPVARTTGPGVRCERRELFGFGLQSMLATALLSTSGRGDRQTLFQIDERSKFATQKGLIFGLVLGTIITVRGSFSIVS